MDELVGYFNNMQSEEEPDRASAHVTDVVGLPLQLPGSTAGEGQGFTPRLSQRQETGGATSEILANAKPLTPEDVERLTAVFFKFDDDGNETLDPDELNKVLEDIEGEKPPQREINLAIMEIDKDFDGTLDLTEFLNFMCVRQHHVANRTDLDIDLCKKQRADAYAKAIKSTHVNLAILGRM